MCIVERYLSFSLRSGILAGCAALRASWLILVSRLGRRTVSLPQRYRRAKHTARALQFRRATPALAPTGAPLRTAVPPRSMTPANRPTASSRPSSSMTSNRSGERGQRVFINTVSSVMARS